MPLPIIVVPVAAVVWGVGLSATAAGVGYTIYKKWDKIKKFFNGKRVIILGQRASGKTTLLTFLMTGKLPISPEQTIGKIKIKKEKNLSMKDLGLDVKMIKLAKHSYDLGGSSDNHQNWKHEVEKSDILIYLFRVDLWKIKPHDIEKNIQQDLNVLKDVVFKKKDMMVRVIGTHIDLDPDFNINDEAKYREEIANEAFVMNIQNFLGGSSRCPEVYFSRLNNMSDIQSIAVKILEAGV